MELFKGFVNVGPVQMEIKEGHIESFARLVIITSNLTPEDVAEAAGERFTKGPVYNRGAG